MASTSNSAVSDYEHLKYRNGDENYIQLNSDEDEDFIPLKSRTKHFEDQVSVSVQNSRKQVNRFPISKDKKSDLDNFDPIKSVPLPLAWSPGMSIEPNPSLFITPDKYDKKTSAIDSGSEKDNILEPRDLNKVPAPTTWSPHPLLQPSVFITPEKPAEKGLKDLNVHKDDMKSKEKLSVRFSLPSNNSDNEMLDSSALLDSYSPITIKGKDIRTETSKVYNPMIYSDESFQEDSRLESSKIINDKDLASLSTTSNLLEKLNQLLESSKSPKDEKSQKVVKDMSNNSTSKDALKDPTSSLRSLNVNKGINKNSCTSAASGTKRSKKHSNQTKQTKAGPHHLSSSVSPYHPSISGACIVREAKHPAISCEYSYPFNSSENTEESEHVFSRPEFHSSMKVRSELDNLCDQEVDVQKAVEVKLSSLKRTEIQEKAAIYTNHMCDQFNNLVDVEPSIDRLCDRVIQMRTGGKVQPQKKRTKDVKDAQSQSTPDLMEFYSGDLQKESPDLSLPGVVPIAPGLISAPHEQAFDCYRHSRVWSGLRDF